MSGLRKTHIEGQDFAVNGKFILGTLAIPLLWISLYAIQGTYVNLRRIFRLRVISQTLFASVFGSIILFFALLLDDEVQDYTSYYKNLTLLFSLHFSFTLIPRLILTSLHISSIHKPEKGFSTILIGGSEKAVGIYNELTASKNAVNHFTGFVNINGIDKLLENKLPYLGHADKLPEILAENEIEEVIIALESTEHDKLRNIISKINDERIVIRILPDMYDILSGGVRSSNIFGALLMQINAEAMPTWQRVVKRVLDMLLSLIALAVLIPFFIALAIIVKLSSPGPILFFQERIGLRGRVFRIIKFRTMHLNAESAGPQLSSTHDPRITKPGRVMRKLRLDEFPQFFNVLVGDMSLVGPRPERRFYIDQIVRIEPQFLELTKVRPGITSWGQVKYGYAENVDQMIQRMKYDLLYLRNRSLALDLKIMLHTVMIIVKAKGK